MRGERQREVCVGGGSQRVGREADESLSETSAGVVLGDLIGQRTRAGKRTYLGAGNVYQAGTVCP